MWKTINRVSERDFGGKSIPSRNVNGKVVTDDGKLAEALNMHFVFVDPKFAENIASKQSDNPLKYIESNDSATFALISIISSHILKCVKKLKNGKACGTDKIPTTLEKMLPISFHTQ